MMPSDFRPALTTMTSERISTMTPLTMEPGLSLAMEAWLDSNSSANDSVMSCFSVEHTGDRLAGPTCCAQMRVDERAGGRGLSAWDFVENDETMAKPTSGAVEVQPAAPPARVRSLR